MAKYDHDDLRDKSDEYFRPAPGQPGFVEDQLARAGLPLSKQDNKPQFLMEAKREPTGSELTDMARNIIQARSGGRVERCHGLFHVGSYSNATHQWGVAMLMWYIWPEDFPRLAIHCLTHDVPEAWVGDIPAPTGRYVPGLSTSLKAIETALNHKIGLPGEHDLNEEDFAKLKACDRLEFWLWSMEQVHLLGNKFAAEGLEEIERYFTEVKLPERADWVYKFLKAQHGGSAKGLLPIQAGVMKTAAGQ